MSDCPPRRRRPGLAAALFLACAAVCVFVKPVVAASGDIKPVQKETDGTPSIFGLDDFGAMVEIAQGYGEAELTKTETGDPVIVGAIDGTAYQLFFLDCTNHRACAVLNFYAIWNTAGTNLGPINEWNRTQPFHKAYLTEDGLPTVELNLSTAGGISGERLADAFDRWTIAMAEFQRQVLDTQF